MSEDLYKEVKCSRCGNFRLKSASFCPHCGYEQQGSWWNKLTAIFMRSGAEDRTSPTRASVFSALLGVGIAIYLFYNAIQRESLQSFLLAVIALIFALRAWFGTRSRMEDVSSEPPTTEEKPEVSEVTSLEDKFYCENCGTQVSADAAECPKCGMRFG